MTEPEVTERVVVERRKKPRAEGKLTAWQVLELYIAVAITVLAVLVTFGLGADNRQSQRIDRLNQEALYQGRVALNKACHRNNPDRKARLGFMVTVANASLRRADAAQQSGLPLLVVANQYGVKHDIELIQQTLEAQRDVAEHTEPVSDYLDLHQVERAAVVDCDAVYPLPANPDDRLPAPTKP